MKIMLGRKCSHFGNIGHNSRTCSFQKESLRLFGVTLNLTSSSSSCLAELNKSFSVECLSSSSTSSSSSTCFGSSLVTVGENPDKFSNGYLSDGLLGRSKAMKKGVAWSEDEHRIFLVGLQKLGKGDWKGISFNFVTTRTPTQVASHAQKYFLRQNSINKRKRRRPSLFDMGSGESPTQNVSNVTESNSKILALKAIEAASSSSSPSDHHHSTLATFESTCFGSTKDSNVECEPPDLELKLAAPSSLYHTNTSHHDLLIEAMH